MKISVITAVFNAEKTIERCVRSVANQTGIEVEHCLIDNVSTDHTVQLARKINPQIRILSEPDQGIYDAMNKGVAIASGEILAWLNADDFYLPGTLAKVVQFFMDHPETSLLHGNLQVQGREVRPASGIASFHGFRVFHPATFVRRKCFEQYGPFRLQYRICADLDFFLTAGQGGAVFSYLDEALTDFSLGGISTKRRKETACEVREILSAHHYSWCFAGIWYLLMRGRAWAASLKQGLVNKNREK